MRNLPHTEFRISADFYPLNQSTEYHMTVISNHVSHFRISHFTDVVQSQHSTLSFFPAILCLLVWNHKYFHFLIFNQSTADSPGNRNSSVLSCQCCDDPNMVNFDL